MICSLRFLGTSNCNAQEPTVVPQALSALCTLKFSLHCVPQILSALCTHKASLHHAPTSPLSTAYPQGLSTGTYKASLHRVPTSPLCTMYPQALFVIFKDRINLKERKTMLCAFVKLWGPLEFDCWNFCKMIDARSQFKMHKDAFGGDPQRATDSSLFIL